MTMNRTRIEELDRQLSGDVLLPGDSGYENARQVWNAMIDRHPSAIVRCASTADVVHAVNAARAGGVPIAIRGGGHNIAGHSVGDDSLVIDLSRMKAVMVEPSRRRVTVQAGARLADVDAATQLHGLAVPLGINSTTGVAGLTLGGGFGWLSRKHGMTIDSLVSAEVVTAAGQALNTSASEHPDLFWALRGGGGNFGVVTRFEFELHRVGPGVLSGLIVYPHAEAAQVLRQYRAFAAEAPDDLSVWAVLRQAPPLPFLPPGIHGREVVVLALFYAGDPGRGEQIIEPLRRFGLPAGEHVGVQPYTDWQQAFDPLLTSGARNYWKSHNLATLHDGLLDVLIDHAGRLPSPQSEIFVGALGGATMRPAPDATAYPHRDARFVVNVHGRWEDPAGDAPGTAWARSFFDAAAPFATGGVYVNFLTADEAGRAHAAWGPNYERLARVKRLYDPANLFRLNQNIEPSSS
jgi:FAD/FMN-containing dehydrogenase